MTVVLPRREGVCLCVKGDALIKFPKLLMQIKPPVKELYSHGEIDETIFDRCLAVVGSRKMTTYGETLLEKFIPLLVDAGITIVSGFMYGVDRKAFDLTLECGGKTIAVLGWGLGCEKLPERPGALFLSEYKEAAKPQLWMFPRRNRIVAGLSTGVWVVEAGGGSGSLITADFAVRYKRQLFATPGPITSRMSMGTNQLIQSGLAKMVLSPSDILSALGWKSKLQDTGVTPVSHNSSSEPILRLLQVEPLIADEIANRLNLSPEELSKQLAMYQLKGLIEEIDGKYCIIN